MMASRFCTLLVSFAALASSACGSSAAASNATPTPGNSTPPPGDSTPPPDPPPSQWTELVSGDWSLQPGTENPRWCQRYPIREDIYVSAIRPVHPPGTHHTTLSLVDDNGSTSCTGSAFGGGGMIFAAGVGSATVQIPEGVAMKLPAGKALVLNLHVYNPGTAPLAGTSKIEIVRAKPEEVKSLADLMFAGPTTFSIPPQTQATIEDTCKLSDDQTAFALFPHMHQLGRHIKTTFTVAGTPMVVHDADYEFEEQDQLPVGPIELHQGDTVKTECTYDNMTGKAVTFGESSDTEMCFSIIYRYPATGRVACGIRQ
ncbi:MAG TPA: hypothetical protein VK540_21615 [Polyangiaceae bacterium]|nr:hypothetical protein [Polyangiaceae bacterium]